MCRLRGEEPGDAGEIACGDKNMRNTYFSERSFVILEIMVNCICSNIIVHQ